MPAILGTYFCAQLLGDIFDWSWWWSALVAGAVMFAVFWVATGWMSRTLVVTPDALHVRRRFRPLTIARDEILSVRGDVPDRPSWSTKVIVETKDGAVTLPDFPGHNWTSIIEKFQTWSGTDQNGPRLESNELK